MKQIQSNLKISENETGEHRLEGWEEADRLFRQNIGVYAAAFQIAKAYGLSESERLKLTMNNLAIENIRLFRELMEMRMKYPVATTIPTE
jgi:hypothetical protein